MEDDRPQETPKAAASISASQDATNQQPKIDGITARLSRLTDKQVLRMSGLVTRGDLGSFLAPFVRDQLARVIAEFGEPAASREQAAAHAAGMAAFLHFAGASRIVAEVQTCAVGKRIGFVGGASVLSPKAGFTWKGSDPPDVTTYGILACSHSAATVAAQNLNVLNMPSAVGYGAATYAGVVGLTHLLDREMAEMRQRVIELVQYALDRNRDMALEVFMALCGAHNLNEKAIARIARSTGAARLDARDSVAEWFTDSSIVGVA
jgi:hypothetical protein